jgi:predicted ATP-binding protein involved in virulence
MISRFRVSKLTGVWDFDLRLNSDLNVLTGRNGAGKTTVLKLLWYLISGNIERVVPEIKFDSVRVEGTDFTLDLTVQDFERNPVAALSWNVAGAENSAEIPFRKSADNDRFFPIDIAIARAVGSSVFFPTFRRIEGGFTIGTRTDAPRSRRSLLQEGMKELSESLSFVNHTFVSSISTDDIESLLTQQYAESSQKANLLQAELSEFIETTIKDYNEVDSVSVEESLKDARSILSRVQEKVRHIEKNREVLFQPFTVLQQLVAELLKHKGIRLKDVTTFGDVAAAIEAGHLSAGEKQMLSFLCYNAFKAKSTIFIDEPETSLHVDWQRILFPKLLEQGSDNQFIVATHSPFIYSKYPDKELRLDVDPGWSDA